MAKFQSEVRLSREMTLMDATLIGVGAMIGAGIFVLTGIAAGVAGPALIVAFALNGVFSVTATVLAMLLNFQGGFGLTFIAGVTCYLLASVCLVVGRAISARA